MPRMKWKTQEVINLLIENGIPTFITNSNAGDYGTTAISISLSDTIEQIKIEGWSLYRPLLKTEQDDCEIDVITVGNSAMYGLTSKEPNLIELYANVLRILKP